MVNIGNVYRVRGGRCCWSFFEINSYKHSHREQNEQLTLFWLTFPVHKVDDITILQHVSLLLDQFGHVDHRAISATDRQTNKWVCRWMM